MLEDNLTRTDILKHKLQIVVDLVKIFSVWWQAHKPVGAIKAERTVQFQVVLDFMQIL